MNLSLQKCLAGVSAGIFLSAALKILTMIQIEAGNERVLNVYLEARDLCNAALTKLAFRNDSTKAVDAARPFIHLSMDLLVRSENNLYRAPLQSVKLGIKIASLVSIAAIQFFKILNVRGDMGAIAQDLRVIDTADGINKDKDLCELALDTIEASGRVLNFVYQAK